MGDLLQSYKDAMNASTMEVAALILDRAAEDYSLTLIEYLDLVRLFDRLFA